MEKKMVYVVCENDVPLGDSHEINVVWELDKAKDIAENCLAHLTTREKAKTAVVIEGYTVEVTGNAKESWRDYHEDKCWLPDAEYYEVVEE